MNVTNSAMFCGLFLGVNLGPLNPPLAALTFALKWRSSSQISQTRQGKCSFHFQQSTRQIFHTTRYQNKISKQIRRDTWCERCIVQKTTQERADRSQEVHQSPRTV